MTTHAAALAQPMADGELYLEIEGIPYAFGTRARDSSWFDVPGQAFEGIKPALRIVDSGDLPTISAQRVDFLESRVSIGSLRLGIVDTDEALDDNGNTLAGYVAPWRRDNVLRLVNGTATTVSGSNTGDTTILVTDASVVAIGSRVLIGVLTYLVVAVDYDANTITLSSALPSVPTSGTVAALSLAASADATSASVDGDTRTAGNVSGWPASGVCWLGTEACAFTRSGSDLTIARGRYRSQPAYHQGRDGWTNETGDEARVTLYPDGLVGRRCWLRWGMDAASDADAVDLFVGSIANAQWDNGARVLVVELEDAQSWLRRPLFGDLPDRLPEDAIAQRLPAVGVVYLNQEKAGLPDREGAQFVIAAGESLLLVENVDVSGVLAPEVREVLFGPAGEFGGAWPPDAPTAYRMRPAVYLGPSTVANRASGVLAPPDGVKPHPLRFLLAILSSTGAGTNGVYDVLPAEWGLGIPVESIDVDGIEALAEQTPQLEDFRAIIVEPVDDFREWAIQTLLKPFGFCLRPTFDHPIAVKQILAAAPDDIADATALDLSDVAIESGRIALLEGPTQENAAVVGSVTVTSDPYLEDGEVKWGDRVRLGIVSSDVRRGYQSAKPLEIESWLPRDDSPRGEPSRWSKFYSTLLDNLWARFEVPPVVLRVAVQPNPFLRLNAGDYVAVTLPDLPSATSNTRGHDATVMEVWSKSIDLPSNRVVLELAQTSVTLRRVRYLGPALTVATFTDDSPSAGQGTITVDANAYTDAAGTFDDADAFAAGQNVILCSADFVTEAGASIASVTGSTLVLNEDAGELGVTPAAGWHVTLADFDDVTAVQTSRYAYCADESARLGVGNDGPHVHA